jgi:hypothetical protein
MKILLADERSLFCGKVHNKTIAGTVHFTGHVTGQSALIGTSHG